MADEKESRYSIALDREDARLLVELLGHSIHIAETLGTLDDGYPEEIDPARVESLHVELQARIAAIQDPVREFLMTREERRWLLIALSGAGVLTRKGVPMFHQKRVEQITARAMASSLSDAGPRE